MNILADIIYGYDLSVDSNVQYLEDEQFEKIKSFKDSLYSNGFHEKYHGYLDFVGYFGVKLGSINSTARNIELSSIANIKPSEKDIIYFNQMLDDLEEDEKEFMLSLGEPKVLIIWYTK